MLGVVYFVFMMVGAVDRAHAGAGLEAGGLYAAGGSRRKLITKNDVYVYEALKTPQFWLHLVGALPQRDRRHRRARPGLGDEPGDVPGQDHGGRGGGLRRPDEPVQHGRPLLLGVDLRLYRPQEHLFRASSCSASLLYALVPYTGAIGSVALFVLCFLRHHQHVWRRLRHRAGLSQGHVRHALCRRHPRPADHRLVDGRHLRAGAGELHPRSTRSTTACRRRRPTTSPCTSWRGCW